MKTQVKAAKDLHSSHSNHQLVLQQMYIVTVPLANHSSIFSRRKQCQNCTDWHCQTHPLG